MLSHVTSWINVPTSVHTTHVIYGVCIEVIKGDVLVKCFYARNGLTNKTIWISKNNLHKCFHKILELWYCVYNNFLHYLKNIALWIISSMNMVFIFIILGPNSALSFTGKKYCTNFGNQISLGFKCFCKNFSWRHYKLTKFIEKIHFFLGLTKVVFHL